MIYTMKYKLLLSAAFVAVLISLFIISVGAAHAASNSITGYFVIADSVNQSSSNDINASVSGAPGDSGKIPGITGAAVGPGAEAETPDLIALFKGMFLRVLKFFPWFS